MSYNHQQIGLELQKTAAGDSYYGNALYVALDMPELSSEEKDVLHRYLHGSELTTDRMRLQEIAIKVVEGATEVSYERAAFEAWMRSDESPLNTEVSFGSEIAMVAHEAWQASRKAALEEAATLCHCIALRRVGSALECTVAIRSLK